MLRTLSIWAVLAIMDLLMSLWPGQELRDPGRRPNLSPCTSREWNVALTAHRGQWSAVRREKSLQLLPKCISSQSTLAREQGKWELAEEGLPGCRREPVRQDQVRAHLHP